MSRVVTTAQRGIAPNVHAAYTGAVPMVGRPAIDVSELPTTLRRSLAAKAAWQKRQQVTGTGLSPQQIAVRRWCNQATLPMPVCEHKFHPTRGWKFDYAWPEEKVALEVDGGIWVAGRHTRGAGWLKDTDKLNAACCEGWRMLRCTPQQLLSDDLLATLCAALAWHAP